MYDYIRGLIPPMLTGEALDREMRIAPIYDASIQQASAADRLIALQDLYNIYVPTAMSREVYSKLYLSLLRSMTKKQSLPAIRQFSENQRHIKGKEFTSIIGGSDSFTIIGDSGIGKSATVSRVIDMISVQRVINLPNSMRIIPCVQVQTPANCSTKGLLFEILRKVDEILDTRYHFNAMRVNATADMLIGSVSTVALNHIGLLVVDEIQNVVSSKNGTTLIGTLTQLINNAGISICMVGTPKSALFFGQEMMLARRSLGLSYAPFAYDETFAGFCNELLRYQYVRESRQPDEGLLQWLYNHSSGNASIVVSLIHDAQEIAILDGTERLEISSLEKAYHDRLALLHDFLYHEPVEKKHTGKRNRAEAAATDTAANRSENFISEVVLHAKQLHKDVVAELTYSGVYISEVTV